MGFIRSKEKKRDATLRVRRGLVALCGERDDELAVCDEERHVHGGLEGGQRRETVVSGRINLGGTRSKRQLKRVV